MLCRRSLRLSGLILSISLAVFAQAPQGIQNVQPNVPQAITVAPPNYELGPNDQILVTAPNVTEINGRPFRIDSDGNIEFPLLTNKIHAAGLNVQALETVLKTQLRDYVRDPQVSITITGFRTDYVYFRGAFRTQGAIALQGGRTLDDMLAIVGGLQPNASRRITITRRAENGPIPLPYAVEDPMSKDTSVEINLDTLTQSINPPENIVLKVYDRLTAELAKPVYVFGEVPRPMTITLAEQPSITVTQALTQAGGFTQAASRGKVEILRPILGTTKLAHMVVNLDRIYKGLDNDVPLLPNDELRVPRATARVLFAPVATGILTSLPYLMITLAISGVF